MRTPFWALAVVLGFAACNHGGAGVRKRYTLKRDGAVVNVSMAVPAAWKEEVDPDVGPSFYRPGREMPPVIMVTLARCPEQGDCLASVIRQYGVGTEEGAPQPKREELGAGRVLMTTLNGGDMDRNAQASLFAPHSASKTMVVCTMLDEKDDLMPALRQVCESLAF